MIIELTGVSGSGKSSIYSALENKMDDIKFISNKKKGLLNEIKLFTLYALHSPNTRYNNLIIKLIIKSNNTLYHKLNIVRNVIKKISLYTMLKSRKDIYLIDEGVSHIPFSIFVDSSTKKLCNTEISNFINLIPTPNFLLIINAGKKETRTRLKNRGHKRINLSDDEKTKVFLSKSFIVKDQIIRYYKNNNKKYKIVTNKDSIENAVKVAKNFIENTYV